MTPYTGETAWPMAFRFIHSAHCRSAHFFPFNRQLDPSIDPAHGAYYGSDTNEEQRANPIDPTRLEIARLGYPAPSVWHGELRVKERCRYSGTPETGLFQTRGMECEPQTGGTDLASGGAKVPARQPRRGRIWLNCGSCVRLSQARRNEVWAYALVQVRTHNGRLVRLLTMIDEYTRECSAIRAQRSIRSCGVNYTML